MLRVIHKMQFYRYIHVIAVVMRLNMNNKLDIAPQTNTEVEAFLSEYSVFLVFCGFIFKP